MANNNDVDSPLYQPQELVEGGIAAAVIIGVATLVGGPMGFGAASLWASGAGLNSLGRRQGRQTAERHQRRRERSQGRR